MNPDKLCITEATPDLPLLQKLAATLHVPYVAPTIPGKDEALVKMPSNPRKALCKLYGYPDNALFVGQWIWFQAKASLNLQAELQDPKIWHRFAASWLPTIITTIRTARVAHWAFIAGPNARPAPGTMSASRRYWSPA